MTTFASLTDENHSRLKHSSLSFPLKLSPLPFCHGLPGSINKGLTPFFVSQPPTALPINSLPQKAIPLQKIKQMT
jgi:hypothetical protein